MRIKSPVLRVGRFVAWVCFLEILWAIFVGTTQSTELIAGLIASVVTAFFVEALRAQGLLGFRFAGSGVARAWNIPGHIVLDFVVIFWVLLKALAARRRVRGVWVESPYEAPEGARGRFVRALTVALENETPNALVVDLDGGRVLLHSLETRVKTGREVM